MSTMKETKSGKVACQTPGCRRVATHIIHVAHIRSWGRPKDLYHCEQHACNATLIASNPAGYIATDECVMLSPLASEVMGHHIEAVPTSKCAKKASSCEVCDGKGCMACSDDIYYAIQETAEQAKRDRSRDLAFQVAGDRPELGWDQQS